MASKSNTMDFKGLTLEVGALDFDGATAVADLNQTISETYDDAEVQAISDKVDALLAALRSVGVIASS